MPVACKAFRYGDKEYFDGGVAAPLPIEKAFEMVSTKQIDMNRYITSVYDLKDINKAFESAKDLNNLKILISCSQAQ